MLFFLSEYLRFDSQMLSRLVITGLAIGALAILRSNPRLGKSEVAAFSAFSILFDFSLVMGYHIAIGDDTYSGLIDNSYVTDYTLADVVAFGFMFIVILAVSLAAYSLIKHGFPYRKGGAGNGRSAIERGDASCRISPKFVLVLALVLFFMWVPYLVVYYPGLIFGDTVNSFNQIVNARPLSDHHPVLYTMFIKCCWWVAHAFGFGNAAGCALYSVIQMAVMAACFAYLIAWIAARLRFGSKARIALYGLGIAYFGISPYVATYSIAMWKDPLFSVSLMMITLLIADAVVFRKGRTGFSLRVSLVAFAVFAFLAVFFRHNGVYILILLLMAMVVWLPLSRGDNDCGDCASSFCGRSARSQTKWMSAICAIMIVVFFVVSGPVFTALGVVKGSSAESLGIPLNQMARVASSGGDMTESDEEYLDSILPIELYSTTYRPCCTDMLKWDANFNQEALSDGFFSHWLSMMVRNPRTYLEAWELQTCGFWAVNVPAADDFGNISGGVVYNNTASVEKFGIDSSVGIQNETVRSLFPLDEASIPVGVILWAVLYLCCCVCCLGRAGWLVVFVPSIALLATLLVASPIWYWPRYAAAVQFLVPLFAVVPLFLRRFAARSTLR